MNTELKKAWYVYQYDEPQECIALFNNEGKAIHFSWDLSDDEIQKVYSDVHVFETFEEAKEYLNSIQPTFNKSKVKEYIAWLYGNNKENELKQLLPGSVFVELKRKSFVTRYDFDTIVSDVAKGVINIDAISIRIDQVSNVCHGNNCVQLELVNGKKIKTRTELEYAVVKAVFGSNYSGRTYTSIKPDID